MARSRGPEAKAVERAEYTQIEKMQTELRILQLKEALATGQANLSQVRDQESELAQEVGRLARELEAAQAYLIELTAD